MFERNMAIRIFTYFMVCFFGFYLLTIGHFLYVLLSKYGVYDAAIASLNYILLYFFLFDFIIKYLVKQSRSMQIVPYLTLPVKRNTLFNYLLVKEFTSVWNLYLIFMLIPFVLKAIPPYYGYLSVFLYVLFIYFLCVCNSLSVNIANNILKRSGWFFLLPFIVVAAIVCITFIPGVGIEDGIVKACGFILEKNVLVWMIVAIVFGILWGLNLSMMNATVYRELQGKRISKAGLSFNIPFIDRLGRIGVMINLDLKMMFRSKRLKNQPYGCIYFIILYFSQANIVHFKESYFNMLFFTVLIVGWFGLSMAQLIFSSESSYFDGLMTKKLSMLDMLKGKYLLYASYSVLVFLIFTVLVFLGKLDFIFLISVLFYTIGFVFFILFQSAVYNNNYFDLSDSAMLNWKGTGGNMLVVSLLSMIVPIAAVMIIKVIFNETVANYYMLIIGVIFAVTTKYWLTWTYNRFLKRKYKNMEGFRIEM